MRYSIQEKDMIIGEAHVTRAGLYYNISCRLYKAKSGLHRITVYCAERSADLGICVPVDGILGIDTSVPIRLIGEGNLIFKLAGECNREVIPILPSKPLACLLYHRKMRYTKVMGEAGITLVDASADPLG